MVFPYMPITVGVQLVITALDLYVTTRQHRRYHPSHTPSHRISSVIPHNKFVQAQAYCRAKSSFSIITSLIHTVLDVYMTLIFFAPTIWTFSEAYANGSELRQTFVFLALSSLLSFVIDLPTSIYSTFVLEAKYGFNRTTVKTFIIDIVKQFVLSAVIGLPIISAVYYVLLYLSVYPPLTVALGLWILLSTFIIVMMIVYPTVIAPMFNTFSPLSDGSLKDDLVALAKKLKFPLDKLYVIDGSRRSSHSNAYIFGFVKKYICIYDSLLEQTKGKDQLVVSILCHELGHWYHYHLVSGLVISLVQVFITSLLYGLTAGQPDLFKSFGYNDGMPLIIGIMLFNNIFSPVDTILTPLQNMLSRHFEYQADAFAKSHGMADDLGKALVGISISNLSNMSPDPLYSAWNYSHPTLIERLDALNTTPELDTTSSVKGEKEE